MTAEEIIKHLNLKPHPAEGGFFSEIYRSEENLVSPVLSPRYEGERSVSTAIYYLLTPDTFSAMHRLASDEVFHFYLGDPVEQLQLFPDGTGQIVTIGNDLSQGHQPQSIVARGVWQGARLAPGGRYALMGTTVAPGFDFADYDHGDQDDLCAEFPAFSSEIGALIQQ